MSDHEGESQDLYDEFGNYIGPDLDSSSNDDDDDDDESETNLPTDNAVDDDDSSDGENEGDANNNKNKNNNNQQEQQLERSLVVAVDPMSQIVLHEDKEHYPSAEQVYGPDVTAAVLDEDAMDIDTPILPNPTKNQQNIYIHPHKQSSDSIWNYDDNYLNAHIANPENDSTRNRRGIAIVGHFHHGKTSLVDLLLEPTLKTLQWETNCHPSLETHRGGGPRFTDLLLTEQLRQMSLVSTPLSGLFYDTRGKSYCLTLLDCPGHVNFHDESVAALRIMDGALLVVDAVEGIMMHTEMILRQIIAEGLPIVLCINKIDRLILELKLPPNDAYFKLQHVLDSINQFLQQHSQGRYPILAPQRNNVVFASAIHGWIFTLESFAQVYLEQRDQAEDSLGHNLTPRDLAQRLWGECYLDTTNGTFHKHAQSCRIPSPQNHNDTEDDTDEPMVSYQLPDRTFVSLILQPLYKIYSHCLAEPESSVKQVLTRLGIFLSQEELRGSARPLLRSALSQFLASAHGGFVQALITHIPCPALAAPAKIRRCYSGPCDTNSLRVRAMLHCDPQGPLTMHVVKQYAAPDDANNNHGQAFFSLARIYSGTLRPATTVRILGESYTPHDQEDAVVATVEAIWIPRGPQRTLIQRATAGNWVLLQGVDANIAKTATLVGIDHHNTTTTTTDNNNNNNHDDEDDECYIFEPLQFHQAGGESIMKLAIEPLKPAELPKMVEGLRRISKAYPMVKTKVEESGEHVVLGTGELYLDCVMHDLRQVYSDVEVKVADPIVAFRETVIDTSSVKCLAETANKRNKLTFIAEPLEEGLAEKLETGKIRTEWDVKKMGGFFQKYYHWDLLSSRSIWAFGDSATHGPNILMNDTLPGEIDGNLLNSCRSSIVQGFRWAMREGPLCEEPVRGTKLKLLDVTLADKPIYRGGGQVIPTARRTVHSSLLTATPRLMEPVFHLQIQCPKSMVEAIQPVLVRRRGHVVQDQPIAGTLLYSVRGFLPVLDSFGFETDLRTFTQGRAMVHAVFSHWSIVPGDPLDRSILLHPLEPSPPPFLARELLVKTRRRKGLAEDVSVNKFFDEAMKAPQEDIPRTTGAMQ